MLLLEDVDSLGWLELELGPFERELDESPYLLDEEERLELVADAFVLDDEAGFFIVA